MDEQGLPLPQRTLAERWARRRRWVAAGLTLVAVFFGLRALAPPPDLSARVLAARVDLEPGHEIQPGDLTWVHVEPKAAEGSLLAKESDAVGKSLAVSWPAQVPLTSTAFSGSNLATSLPPGQVAVGLSLPRSSSLGFLRTGDLVDVVVTRPDPDGEARSSTVQSGVRVLALSTGEGSSGWLGQGSTKDDAAVVVLAVPRSESASVAGAPQRGAVSLVVAREH